MWQLWDITFDLIQRRALNIHPMQMAMLGTVWGHGFFLFRDYLALFNAWWIKNPGLSHSNYRHLFSLSIIRKQQIKTLGYCVAFQIKHISVESIQVYYPWGFELNHEPNIKLLNARVNSGPKEIHFISTDMQSLLTLHVSMMFSLFSGTLFKSSVNCIL